MAQCVSLACPRLQNTDPDNRALALTFASGLATRDCLGNVWCNYCRKQPALIAWAKKNNWPPVQAIGLGGRYRIAEGCWNWKSSIMMGNQDMINAFSAELIGNEEEQAS